jgi:hypothetical protein
MAKRTRKPKDKAKPAIPPALAEKLAHTPRRAAAEHVVQPPQRAAGHSPAPMRHQGR